jgi:hypothetical protein
MKYVQISYLNVQLGKWKNANSEVQSTERVLVVALPLISAVIYLDL